MRGLDQRSGSLFSYVDIEARIAEHHPLRLIRAIVNEALAMLDAAFDKLYADEGRPGIPPAVAGEPAAAVLLDPLGAPADGADRLRPSLPLVCGAGDRRSGVGPHRDRLLNTAIAQGFLAALLAVPRVKRRLSRDHFTVDGTLLKAWASLKGFRPKDGGGPPPDSGRNGERDFRGEKRSNATQASTTDPDARLYRKGDGRESVLCSMGHALMENRHGLAVDGAVTHATGTAERAAALALVDRQRPARRVTLGGDKGYDVAAFVDALRAREVTPHIAIDGHVRKSGRPRKTAIDRRATRHRGYAISQVIRKRIEEIFGWTKTTGGLAQVKLRGLPKVRALLTFGLAAYNLIRLPQLLEAPA